MFDDMIKGQFLPEVEVKPFSDSFPHVIVCTTHFHAAVRPLILLHILYNCSKASCINIQKYPKPTQNIFSLTAIKGREGSQTPLKCESEQKIES